MTATEVFGFGQQHGHLDPYRHSGDDAILLPKTRLDIVVSDETADILLDALAKSAWTGHIGDGKIWVTPVDSVVRVRSGELDASAV